MDMVVHVKTTLIDDTRVLSPYTGLNGNQPSSSMNIIILVSQRTDAPD